MLFPTQGGAKHVAIKKNVEKKETSVDSPLKNHHCLLWGVYPYVTLLPPGNLMNGYPKMVVCRSYLLSNMAISGIYVRFQGVSSPRSTLQVQTVLSTGWCRWSPNLPMENDHPNLLNRNHFPCGWLFGNPNAKLGWWTFNYSETHVYGTSACELPLSKKTTKTVKTQKLLNTILLSTPQLAPSSDAHLLIPHPQTFPLVDTVPPGLTWNIIPMSFRPKW